MKDVLKTETNTPAIDKRVLRAAHRKLGRGKDLRTFFEHGHWWVEDGTSGAQYSVVDAEGPGVYDGFDFEQVTEGKVDDGTT